MSGHAIDPRNLARAALAAALVSAAAGATAPASGRTSIEGEYQLMLDLRKQDRNYPWSWDSNNNDNWTGAQLRLFSQPRPNVETFLKFEADWNTPNNDLERPEFQFREAHLRYRWDMRGRGIDSYLFSRQDRFWVDNYLIRIIQNGSQDFRNDNNGTNAQGVRVDTWGFLGANGTFIASDFSQQFDSTQAGTSPLKTDDAYVVRLRREFLRDRVLRLGLTWSRKEENQPSEPPDHAEVLGFDSRFRHRGVDYSLEYATSRTPTVPFASFPSELGRKVTVFGWESPWRFPDRDVLVAEIRSLRVGTSRIGYLNVAPTYWRRGAFWENRGGDAIRDEVGYNLNGWYLLPERAVTISSNYRSLTKHAIENREEREFYNEAYIEFVNGFNGKTYYRDRQVIRRAGREEDIERHRDAFFEVQVESRLAWLRMQTKLKDLGEVFRKQLYAIDYSLNLSRTAKIYNRFVLGNDAAATRKGVFLQLQYRPTGNMEAFLEYGPGWIGDSNVPVDDGDLEGTGDQSDLVKFILKGNF